MTTESATTGTRRQRDEQFRLLIESVRDYAIFMLDPDGHIVSWNAGAERIKGYTAEEIIGMHFSVFYPHEAIARRWPQHNLEAAVTHGRYEEEGWRIRKDGTPFWADVVITTLRDASGDLVGFAKVTRDLTERHTIEVVTEAALSHLAHDELLRELLKRASEAIAADTAAILLVSENEPVLLAQAAWGLEEEVERGVRIPIGHGFAGRVAAERRPIVLTDVRHSEVLNPILRKKGITSLLGVPLIVEGALIGVLHVGRLERAPFSERDAHLLQIVGDRIALAIDRARLFEVARKARREADIAEAAVKERDEFLSIAAHELKTPMTSVKAAAQLLLRAFERAGGGDTSQRRALQTIDRQVTKLGQLVIQLLEAVRVQAGELVLQVETADLAELARAVAEQIQQTTARHAIVVDAPERLMVRFDTLRMEQVLTNLLDNAVKYSPGGGEIRVAITQPSPATLTLTVRDHGIGVAPEHRARLFQRFYQAHRDRSGMGLGLYITRRIVERHGGTIYADFPADGGTRFVVSLPT